jgi:hypothetical protein
LVSKILTDAAAIGTFLGVLFAGWQLWLNRQQAKTEFEDRMTELYRALAAQLPVEVFFDKQIDRDVITANRAIFYRYFDLCNEQAFLHKRGRIRDHTWIEWQDGIRGNMERHAFDTAWHEEIGPHIGKDFQDFRDELVARPSTASAATATP